MIEFDELIMRGFCAFDDSQDHVVKLNTESSLILGINNSSDAATSNGAGKSTIYKAISWCLYGETYDGDKGDDVVHNKSKGASVQLKLKDDYDVVTITRQRKNSETKVELRKFDKNGHLFLLLEGHKDCVEYVEQMLGMDWPTFKNTVMYCQQDFKRFADPVTTDAERKTILRRILNLDVVAEASRIARKRANDIENALVKQQTVKADLETALNTTKEDLETHEKADQDWKHSQSQKIEKVVVQLTEAKKTVKDASKVKASLERARSLLSKAEADIEEVNKQSLERMGEISVQSKKVVDLMSKHATSVAKHEQLVKQLANLDGDECPICTSPLDSGEAAKHIKGLKTELSKEKTVMNRTKKALSAAKDVEDSLKLERDGLVTQLDDLDGIRHKIKGSLDENKQKLFQMESSQLRIVELEKQLKELENESNPFGKQIGVLKKRLHKQGATLRSTQKQVEEKQIEQTKMNYWTKVFGQGGLINWAIQSVIPFLESAANEYLKLLTDGDIILTLDTSTSLKSGKSADKISMLLDIEGCQNVKPSGGQAKKVSLAVSLALMALIRSRTGANVSNLFLDEPDIGLDDAGNERFYGKLLSLLVRQYGHIMVITHDPNVRAYFGEIVHVTRSGGRSWIQ